MQMTPCVNTPLGEKMNLHTNSLHYTENGSPIFPVPGFFLTKLPWCGKAGRHSLSKNHEGNPLRKTKSTSRYEVRANLAAEVGVHYHAAKIN
jgi:hypothetical protein